MSSIPTRRPDVAAYVAAVRTHLDDLAPDEAEELTGGLEADLTDLAAESDVPLADRIGPPAAYADELRAAAGLPARVGRPGRAGALARFRTDVDELHEALRRQRWWPEVSSFLVTLRPVWWVGRALVALWLVGAVLGSALGSGGLLWFLVAVVLVVGSVELGRGRWSRLAWVRPLVLVGNVLAVLLLPPFAASRLGGHDVQDQVGPSSSGIPTGLTSSGVPVTNVFGYDEQGRPLTRVQLFDQDGRPLAVQPDELAATDAVGSDGLAVTRVPVPATDVYGRQLWNVFPVRSQLQRDSGTDAPPVAEGVPQVPPLPLAAVAPLAPLPAPASPSVLPSAPAPGPGATTAPRPATSPSASAGPSPSISATTPSPSASSSASPSASTSPSPSSRAR
jgi:hypothetical protein